MLTKTDLKQIKGIVKTENESFEKRLDRKIEKIDKKLDFAINILDRDYIKLLERVERIEKHLQLPPIT